MRHAFKIVLVAAMMLASPLAAAQAQNSPRISIDDKGYIFNAGDVPEGQPIVHDFLFKNTGTAPLTIKAKPC